MLTIVLIAQLAAADCAALEDYAEIVMEKRQAGVSPSTMVDAISAEEYKAARQVLSAIILDAYDRPRFSTEEFQQQMVQDFSAEVYLACMTAD